MKTLARLSKTKQITPRTEAPSTDDRLYVRIGLSALTLTFVFLLAWAALAPLRSAVVATGRLTAASENQTIEHLDGGLIDEILVRDGDLVSAGQVLLRLDPQPLRIQRDNADSQLFEIQANLERLAAERAGVGELTFSAQLLESAETDFERDILATQQALFETRRKAAKTEHAMLAQRAKQADNQIEGLKTLVGTLRQRVSLLDADLKGLRTLESDNLVSASKLRETERRRSELVGEIAEREGEIASLGETVSENRQRIELRKREFQRDVAGELRDLQAKVISLTAARQAVADKLSRVEIRAPADGTVKGFDIATTGAVINAGDPIMEIVPTDQRYRVQARISPMDVDALHPGMQAEIRLSAIDGSRNFPVIHADLRGVSADVFTSEYRDEAYYKALFALGDQSMAVLNKENARLVPGMPVDLYIKTGERTFLDYLTRPLQDLLARALNEA
jgi:HlyD family type I secretion membrane fusion protein